MEKEIKRTQEEIRGVIDWLISLKIIEKDIWLNDFLSERKQRYVKEMQDALHFQKLPEFGSVYLFLTDNKMQDLKEYFNGVITTKQLLTHFNSYDILLEMKGIYYDGSTEIFKRKWN